MSLITATLGKIAAPERRTMAVACGAHVLHDGFTDLLYVLLPLWQAEFGLGYAAIGLLRALYVGSMAGFQMPRVCSIRSVRIWSLTPTPASVRAPHSPDTISPATSARWRCRR